MQSVKIIVYGKVQGVGYRSLAKKVARQMHLVGWVKNLANKTVVIEIYGEDEKLEAMIRWCNKGPEHARVEKIEVEDIPYTDFYKSFEIKYE